MYNCPNCGAPISLESNVCGYCGTPYQVEKYDGCVQINFREPAAKTYVAECALPSELFHSHDEFELYRYVKMQIANKIAEKLLDDIELASFDDIVDGLSHFRGRVRVLDEHYKFE